MFSRLRFLILFLAGLSLGFARSARASHAVGGSLTYTSLGGNSYRVRVDFFRDCSGIFPPSSLNLNCQTACSSTGTTTTLNMVGQPFYGSPYSSAVQPTAVCALIGGVPTGPVNFATYHYEGTVTLAPNQWILSIEEASRPLITNLNSAGNLRLEATLDNRGRVNNSVTFSSQPTIFLPVNQNALLHIGAFDVDGDSLSYSLERPLNACNSYETYTTYPGVGCTPAIDPRCGTRLINCTTPSSGYTQFLPIAVSQDTVFENGSIIRPACPPNIVVATTRPRFAFSALQGTFSFTPNRYLATPATDGDNKYVVVVKVTEWRRENGAYVAIGTTRRDMLWIVYSSPTAATPVLSPVMTVQDGSQTTTKPLTAPIAVLAGEPISVNFSAFIPGTTPLAFTLEQNTVPGAVIQAGAAAGMGRLTFTPPLSLPNGTYRVSVTVTDDASPLRNLITIPVTFHVYRTALATYNAAASAQVSAYPTPFTEQVQFQLPTAGVQQLTVCDNLGRVVAHLTSQVDGKVQWAPGANVPAGLYSARSADGKLSIRLLRSAQ
ncbi:hypothetical protein [Hymenobacter negativus]|uniref:T9SS type A sorting domain-containing protein n=1 Tax=Hymenobacter negativus TaxID=2795026 RepID=A0ABS3QEU7_9BACT|nr:hypothetical protein [Hymenobacter negativus]MBO2009780.1 hypothetical protein [Hymenobacter negativus]